MLNWLGMRWQVLCQTKKLQWCNQYFRDSRMRSGRSWRRPQKMKIFKTFFFKTFFFKIFFFKICFLQNFYLNLQITANLRVFGRKSHFLRNNFQDNFIKSLTWAPAAVGRHGTAAKLLLHHWQTITIKSFTSSFANILELCVKTYKFDNI